MKNWLFGLTLTLVLYGCSGEESQKSAKNNTSPPAPEAVEEKDEKIILFFGNSITAGYQLDMEDAFPALIQDRLDSLGFNYRVINAGLSGETSTSGKNRISWVLRTVPDIFFLELGANDGLRGLQLGQTEQNLQVIIDEVKKTNPDAKVIIAGMQVPPNLGEDYTNQFRTIFPKLAEANEATLIPFLLDGVAGNPELNLSDGIHPTPEGHRIIAGMVWDHLYPLLEKPNEL